MDERDPRTAEDGTGPLRDASRGERLQRVMADAGVASRRVCEQMIEGGRVVVNGQTVRTLPAWVDPHRDRVLVDGQPIAKPEPHLYIMLNKPARTLATPPEGPDDSRRSALAMVEHPLASRLFAAGRLEFEATGLLLLTNDGELANRVTHARYGVEKTYQMVVRGTMDEESLARVNRAIAQVTLRAAKEAGVPRAPRADLVLVAREPGRSVLELTVRDGRAVLVRDTLAALGHPVKSLERVAIGPVRLRGVAVGQWRELERDELSDLRRVAAGKPARGGGARTRAGGLAKPRVRNRGATAAGPKKAGSGGRGTAPKIAKRFRGIGKPVVDESARPSGSGGRRRAGPAATTPGAEGPDRRLGRGPGVNKHRQKPVVPPRGAKAKGRDPAGPRDPSAESTRPGSSSGPRPGPRRGPRSGPRPAPGGKGRRR